MTDGARSAVTSLLPLSELLEAPAGPRLRDIDPSWVDVLAGTPDEWPPVLVDGQGRLIDGWHRAAAAQALGLGALRARVQPIADDAQLLEAAALANRHGLPLTRSARKETALRLLQLDPSMADRRIAAAVGVSATSVGTWRAEAVQIGHLSTSDPVRVGRDGKHYPRSPAASPPTPGNPFTILARLWLAVRRLVRTLLARVRAVASAR